MDILGREYGCDREMWEHREAAEFESCTGATLCDQHYCADIEKVVIWV